MNLTLLKDTSSIQSVLADLVVHLLGAVEDIDHDAQGTPQILGGLCLAGTGWASWSSAHDEMQRLSQSDVASKEEQFKV